MSMSRSTPMLLHCRTFSSARLLLLCQRSVLRLYEFLLLLHQQLLLLLHELLMMLCMMLLVGTCTKITTHRTPNRSGSRRRTEEHREIIKACPARTKAHAIARARAPQLRGLHLCVSVATAAATAATAKSRCTTAV